MKKLIILIAVLCAAAFVSAQTKTSEIKAYLGERYNTVPTEGDWNFYFQTQTIVRKSDGTKTFPQLLASAPNWSDASDGPLTQIRWKGKLLTDMRKTQGQTEKPAAQKLRMVGSGNFDSLKIADWAQNVVQEGPKQLLSFWGSVVFEFLGYFSISMLSLFYFFTKACLNETRINSSGFPVVGRYMYMAGSFFSGIQALMAIVIVGFLAITLYAVFLSGNFFDFLFSWIVIRLAITAVAFSVINWGLLSLVDRITPQAKMIDREHIGISFNSGQQGLPIGGRR